MTREERLAGQEHGDWTEDAHETIIEHGSADYRNGRRIELDHTELRSY